MPEHYDYIRDGAAIYARSFAMIRQESRLEGLSFWEERVAVRMVHACGQPEIVQDLQFSPDFGERARSALLGGAPLLCDAMMVANGITRSRLPAENQVICTLNEPQVPALAKSIGNTRTAAATELWGERLADAVVVIGNAPTALFYLLEGLQRGWPRPAAVIGMAVGFVGAAESKEALAASGLAPFVILRGRKGGSAMAAAAVNALAQERE